MSDLTDRARVAAEEQYVQGRYIARDHIEGFVAGVEWAASQPATDARAHEHSGPWLREGTDGRFYCQSCSPVHQPATDDALRERIAEALWDHDRADDRRWQRQLSLPSWAEAVREAAEWPDGSSAANVQRYRDHADAVLAVLAEARDE